jgi:hypothetical protein
MLFAPSNLCSHLASVSTGIETSRCVGATDPPENVEPHPTAID